MSRSGDFYLRRSRSKSVHKENNVNCARHSGKTIRKYEKKNLRIESLSKFLGMYGGSLLKLILFDDKDATTRNTPIFKILTQGIPSKL